MQSGFVTDPLGLLRFVFQFQHCHFLGLGFDFDCDIQFAPAIRKILHVDEFAMPPRLPAFLDDQLLPDEQEKRLLAALIAISTGNHDATKLNVPEEIGRRLLRYYDDWAKGCAFGHNAARLEPKIDASITEAVGKMGMKRLPLVPPDTATHLWRQRCWKLC